MTKNFFVGTSPPTQQHKNMPRPAISSRSTNLLSLAGAYCRDIHNPFRSLPAMNGIWLHVSSLAQWRHIDFWSFIEVNVTEVSDIAHCCLWSESVTKEIIARLLIYSISLIQPRRNLIIGYSVGCYSSFQKVMTGLPLLQENLEKSEKPKLIREVRIEKKIMGKSGNLFCQEKLHLQEGTWHSQSWPV